jgi:SsrA-binding protein
MGNAVFLRKSYCMSKEKKKQDWIAKNKKAFHDYEILEEIEAGIILTGPEVKSIRAGKVNLKGSFVSILNDGKVYVNGMHVSPYNFADNTKYDEVRRRELLLNRGEIERFAKATNEAGVSIIPTRVYLKKGLVKLAISLARGKKKHDKRHDLKRKSQQREIDRSLKNFR